MLMAADMKRAVRFYQDVIGLEEVFVYEKNEFIVMRTSETVAAGNYTIMISTFSRNADS